MEDLRRLKQNGTLVSVHCRGGVYTDMVFVDIPHNERAENVSRLSFDCTLRQAMLVNPSGENVSLSEADVQQPANSSTVKSGLKQAKEDKSFAYQNILEPLARIYVSTFG